MTADGLHSFLARMSTRQEELDDEQFRYDTVLDEMLVRRDGVWVPVTDLPKGGPSTKKADIETGEDQKGE